MTSPAVDRLISRERGFNVILDDDALTMVVRGTGETQDDKKSYSRVYVDLARVLLSDW
jgi:rod shape-determining protein MreB